VTSAGARRTRVVSICSSGPSEGSPVRAATRRTCSHPSSGHRRRELSTRHPGRHLDHRHGEVPASCAGSTCARLSVSLGMMPVRRRPTRAPVSSIACRRSSASPRVATGTICTSRDLARGPSGEPGSSSCLAFDFVDRGGALLSRRPALACDPRSRTPPPPHRPTLVERRAAARSCSSLRPPMRVLSSRLPSPPSCPADGARERRSICSFPASGRSCKGGPRGRR